MNIQRSHRTLAAALLVGVALTGCGGGGQKSQTAPRPPVVEDVPVAARPEQGSWIARLPNADRFEIRELERTGRPEQGSWIARLPDADQFAIRELERTGGPADCGRTSHATLRYC